MSNSLDEIVDFKQVLFKIINNWFLLFMTLLISFAIAFGYNRYSDRQFNVEASFLVDYGNDLPNASDLLYERAYNNNKILENKELMIKSYPLILQTLEDLDFDIGYFIEGNVKVTESYDAPITVKCENTKSLIGKDFKINVIDDNSYILTDLTSNKEVTKNFNESFLFNGVNLSVHYNFIFSYGTEDIPATIVKFFNLQSLSLIYQNKIKLFQYAKESTVLNISISVKDEKKGVVFINKLIENYIISELSEKNLASKNTISFINDQLVEMRDSLSLIEQQIQDYKNNNKVTDLSLKAQSIYTNIVSLETGLAKTRTTNNYFDYLSNYLLEGNKLEGISVPTSFGVKDAGLNTLIRELVTIQIKKNILIDGGQINNPAIKQYSRQSKQLVLNLQEAIKTSKSANSLLLNDYQSRIKKMENSLNSIPQVEMELLNIERLQVISESIYTFLLKKRAEAKIALSSNVSNIKFIEPAIHFNRDPITPNTRKIYSIALLLGLLAPILYLFLSEIFNDKIITKNDLERLTSIPLLAIIGKNYSGFKLLDRHNPKSSVYEGFRSLRSNLEFLNNANSNKIYLVTSSISGEGKTYIAENLSITFAKTGKKVLLVGADLRKPKIYSDFGLDNSVGISTYMNSDIPLKDVIFSSKVDNLDVLISGPIPSNPSDIFLQDRFVKIFDNLKKIYDIIIIDTPPIGLVTDALNLMEYSDINLYVTRQSYTQKKLLGYVNDLYEKDRVANFHIVFNDVVDGGGAYAYGYGYGYGYTSDSDYFDNNNSVK